MPGGSGGAQQSGSSTSTQTQPAYMYPSIGTGLDQSAAILKNGGPQYYTGKTVAGFSAPQQQAFTGLTDMDQNLLQGSGNPYEDAMFGHMAGATQNQLSSEFAGNGRNVAASQPLRAEQLNNLATGFYGGQYQNDINNAFTAGNNELGIGNQVQGQAQRLMDANKAKYDYYQNLPQQNLTQYLQNINSANGNSSQSSSPLYTNPTANAAGMASIMASLYSMFGSSGTAKAAATVA